MIIHHLCIVYLQSFTSGTSHPYLPQNMSIFFDGAG